MSDQGDGAEGPAEGADGVLWLEPDVWQQDREWTVKREGLGEGRERTGLCSQWSRREEVV